MIKALTVSTAVTEEQKETNKILPEQQAAKKTTNDSSERIKESDSGKDGRPIVKLTIQPLESITTDDKKQLNNSMKEGQSFGIQ